MSCRIRTSGGASCACCCTKDSGRGLDLETDPVASGLAGTLAHPGGHLTGVFFDFPDFSTKSLEVLREVSPRLARLAVLWDPSTGPVQLNALERAASSMGFPLQVIEVKSANEGAFSGAQRGDAEGALLLSSPPFGSNPAMSAKFALHNRLPAISMFPEFAQTDGLIAYGPNVSSLFRQGGVLTAEVLAGAHPPICR